MNATEREQIRLSLLRYLDAQAESAPGRGVSPAVLRQYLVSEGSPVDQRIVQAELVYLQGKGFAEPVRKGISPENALWRITSEGRDEYASMGG